MQVLKQGRTIGKVRRGKRLAAGLIAVALGVAALTACSSGGGGGSSPGSASDTLTVALPIDSPTSFELTQQCSSPMFQLAYEPLIRITKDGGYEPGIAASWQYSSDNTVFTMKIRSGVKFADGTDVTRDSVLNTLNYYKSVPGLNDGYIKPWKIAAVDTDSIAITSPAPFAGMESVLSDSGNCNNGMIISAAGLANPDKLKTATFGAGPYVYDAAQSQNGDHYTYTPNPLYYDKSRQNYKKIILRVMTDQNTAMNALASGQIQVNMTGGAQLADQAKSKGFDSTVGRVQATTIMLWDRAGELTPELGDVRVRRAMALAMDRDSIAKAVGTAITTQDQFTGAGFPGHDDNLPSKYTYDVDQAKKLLADAGYPDGFSMTLEVNSDDPDATIAVNAAVAQLGKIGIKLDLKSLPNSSFFTDFAAKKYSAGAVSYGLYGTLPNESYRLYKLPYSAVWNPFASTDPDLDKAYDALNASTKDTFEANAKQFNDTMTAKAWYIPIVAVPQFIYSKGIDVGKRDPMGQFAISAWAAKK